jgi:hypothetical protein
MLAFILLLLYSASFRNKENIDLSRVDGYKTHDADTGSTKVQIARLSARVQQVSLTHQGGHPITLYHFYAAACRIPGRRSLYPCMSAGSWPLSCMVGTSWVLIHPTPLPGMACCCGTCQPIYPSIHPWDALGSCPGSPLLRGQRLPAGLSQFMTRTPPPAPGAPLPPPSLPSPLESAATSATCATSQQEY